MLIAIQCVAVLLHRSAFTCQMEQKILLIFFSFMMETRFEKQQHVNCSSPNVLSEYVFLSFIHQIQDTNYKNTMRRKDENKIGRKDRNTNTNAIKNPDSYKQNPICSSSDYIFPFVEISCINHKSLIFSYFLASGPFNATTKPVRTSLTGRFSELIPANHKTIFLFIFVFVFVFVLTFCISHLCYNDPIDIFQV